MQNFYCFFTIGCCAKHVINLFVLVVAVAEGDVACAAGGLGEQIANAVIAVCRCQGAGCSFNPPACRIVGVGGSTPVWNEGFTFNYLDLLNPFDNDTYQSQL